MPDIRTPLGVAIYVLITGISNTVDTRIVFQMIVLISGVLVNSAFTVQQYSLLTLSNHRTMISTCNVLILEYRELIGITA